MVGERESYIAQQLIKNNLSAFIQRVFYTVAPGEKYLHNWHIDCIAEYLEACRKREIKRLVINMPPRSMKSICTSVAFPAWLLGHDPSTKIMCASYSQQLSLTHSMASRLVIQSDWYRALFPQVEIAPDQNEKGKFITTARGQRLAVSVGGSATGDGGSYLIGDDLLNPQQAASALERDTCNRWMSQTFSSRLNNPDRDVMILVMQRLDVDDVCGMVLAQGGWEHCCLPAIFNERKTFSIGKFNKTVDKGELLHSQRLSEKVLASLQKDLGVWAYAGQYLQNPVPEGGGILKREWWQPWKQKKAPKCECIIQAYDTAFKDGMENDFTARTTWGIFRDDNDTANIILLERMNQRLQFPELRKEFYRSYVQWDPDLVLIEDKASGQSLIQELKRTGVRLRATKRGKGDDKVSRAHAASIMLEQQVVWYPESKSWAQEVILQCSLFPKVKHDDIVDTVVEALLFLRKYKRVRVESDPEEYIQAELDTTRRFYG